MLQLLPNETKTGIKFIFCDFFTKEFQFSTTFDLQEAESICEGLMKEIEKCKNELYNDIVS